ncbi:MAG: hypothetical protein IPJ75_14280 [Ignavibacteriales bacterium]|nr:hypothetical protein [Ignavibacteriales bacterium]
MKNLRFYSFIFAAILMGFTLQAQPLAVTLNAPATASTGASLTPTLDWTVVDGTGPYNSIVKIYSDALLTTLVYTANAGGAVSHAVSPAFLVFNTRYYWTVTVTDAALPVPATVTPSAFSFTTLLATPALLTPADGFISLSMTPSLTWTMDPSRTNVRYRLLVDDAPGLTLGDINTTTAVNPGSLSASPSGLLPATKYWWTVNAEGF